MTVNRAVRAALVGIGIAALTILPGALATFAQQTGPQGPPPADQPAPPKPPTGQQQAPGKPNEQAPQVAISVESNLVHVDAVVTDEDGNILTGLKKENFRILDDGQPQQITNFSPTEAPVTVVILMEFSARYYGFFGFKAQEWAYGFLSHLTPKDWVAFKIFDIKSELLVDFTHDISEVRSAIVSLYAPGFHEACVYDAVIETLNQLRDVHGKKSILLLSTGFDTFSKHTLDETYKRLKETDVPIFAVGMGEDIDLRTRNGGGTSYLQAKNQLTQFANMTGGYAWFPRFQGEMPTIFNSVGAFLRSQYSLGFAPTSPNDGKFHKLRIEILDDQGNPMLVPTGKKGKMKKVTVYARNGYTSPRSLVGN
ncbi:MAG TPA: VWA domain-containing protein [Candidatus Limnocylindria bacterium]|nr:VWA domain-containing protein [Candidatus Limnocylindria bacterium]